MSRTATATPPPPYFPQRVNTPSMRHGSAPMVHVAKFAPRHTAPPPKKKTRNISSTFSSGLGKARTDATAYGEGKKSDDALGLSFEEVSTFGMVDSISRTESHCSVSSAISVDSANGDSRVTPAPSMTTSYAESFVSSPYPTTPSSSRTPSVCNTESQEHIETETNGSSRPSWVPYFGKMAKAVVNTSITMSMPFSDKRKKETVKSDIFVPTGPTPQPTRDELSQLSEEAQDRRHQEWALEQQKRVTECARLCSQWPYSGYNQSKWGPNGSKGFYEPQSYANPQYVASLMARQADLERNMHERSALFFTCRRYRASSEDSSMESYDSTQSSPIPSSRLMADLSAAMGSPLILPSDVKGEENNLENSLTDLDVFAQTMALESSMDVDQERSMSTSEILSRPASVIRPVRAQSCGAKRPLTGMSEGEEEEKRRKVDEAMVVQDAVNDGVIMPQDHRSVMSSKAMSSSVPDLSAAKVQAPKTAVFGHFVKTSDTHPIIISPFLPQELMTTVAQALVMPQQGLDVTPLMLGSKIDIPSLLLSHAAANCRGPAIVPSPVRSSFADAGQSDITLGNLLLSSCPGKRLRMEGPVRGRGPVCRDLATDLRRIKSEGVGALVCCLDDHELALLGVPWETYHQVALVTGLDVIRLPMPDGFTPVSLSLFDSQVSLIATQYSLKGINVLVHCRGGVGRAGLTASAWAIKMGLVPPHPSLALVEEAAVRQAQAQATAKGKIPPPAASVELPAELEHQIVMSIVERVIAMIRARRGLKAIESFEQVQFLASYVRWIRLRVREEAK